MAGNNESKFVSQDGPDAQGVRAEVHVQKGTGTIISIKPGTANVTAQVAVKNENPKVKFPIMGWVPINDPIYPLIQEAFDSQTPIEYRFESQRKPNEPRDTPIAELRATVDAAREHTTPIFAGINGQLSSEAVTNPAEDPAPGGRIRAVDTPAPVVQQQPAQQNQQQQQQQYSQGNQGNGYVAEEPPFKEYNSDGSVNYGSYAIQAAVGAESLVRRLLADRDTSVDTIAHYATVLLAIADKVQSYVTNKKPSRMSQSHTRVRGIVYDTVENFFPIPDNHEHDLDWVAKVGTLSRERFAVIERVASTNFDFASLKGKPASVQQAPQKELVTSQQHDNQQSAGNLYPEHNQPQQSVPTPDEPAEAPVNEPESAPAQEPAVEETERPQGDLSALSILGGDSEKAFEIYPQQDISALSNDPKVSPETMATFKEWVSENSFDLTAIFKLLNYTFGAGHVASLPENSFVPFLDFYVGHGEDNFAKVLDYAETISGS
jgi:hypothetical protein